MKGFRQAGRLAPRRYICRIPSVSESCMRLAVLAIGLVVAAVPAAAQPNPFKLPKSNLKGGAEVTYTLSGDITGNAMMAFEGDRWVRKQTGTMKKIGRASCRERAE